MLEEKTVPLTVLTASYGAATDVGRVREHNEDSFLAQSPVFLVADGMGGHLAGEIASQQALSTFSDLVGRDFVTPDELSRRLEQAAVSVHALGQGDSAPGTTLSGLVLSTQNERPCVRVVNIGDSRTYHFASGTFSQVTRDHSEVQELVDAGWMTAEEARFSGRRNVITRALGAGIGADAAADIFLLPAHAGDRFVICSDGLSGEVPPALIEMVARCTADPQAAAEELVNRALTAGGRDNVTVIVVDIDTATPAWESVEVDDTTIPGKSSTAALAEEAAQADTIPRSGKDETHE